MIDKATFPEDELEMTAWTEDGLVMAARHRKYPHLEVSVTVQGSVSLYSTGQYSLPLQYTVERSVSLHWTVPSVTTVDCRRARQGSLDGGWPGHGSPAQKVPPPGGKCQCTALRVTA